MFAIRRALAEGTPANVISEQYSITRQMVSLIQTGRSYADLPGPILRPARRAEPLTLQQAEEIRRQVQEGQDRRDIAAAFGVSRWTVDSVAIGRIPGRGSETARKNTREEVRQIRHLYRQGVTQKEIAGGCPEFRGTSVAVR